METTVIDAGISSKHARNWKVGEAIRELVQNWLDVRNEFNCAGTISWKDGKAIMKDAGPGLQMKHLSFGENDKAEGSIGQFGEGMKSAFIVLVREGRHLEIRSNGRIIRPVLSTSVAFGVDTLHYEISPMIARHAARLHGTVIEVECSEDELAEGKSYFVELIRQERKAASKKAKREGRQIDRSDLKVGFNWVERGKISLPGGLIYVKGSVVGTITDAMFSYHLEGIEAAQATNRDRDAVNMDVVKPMIREMVANTSSRDVMKAVLDDMVGSGKGSHFESHLSIAPYNKAKIWHRVWNEVYGSNWVVSSDSNNDFQAEYRGFKVLRNLDWSMRNFLSIIGIDDTRRFESKGKKGSTKLIGPRSLTADELATFNWIKAMAKKYYVDPGKVLIAENLNKLAGATGSVVTNGLHIAGNDKSSSKVYLARHILADREQALHVLLHELVHRESGESDGTHEFETALLNVSIKIIMGMGSKFSK